jgi:hypothetical protein
MTAPLFEREVTMNRPVKRIRTLPDNRRAVELADGRRSVLDRQPLLDRPGLQRLKDPIYFASVGIRFGALTWPHDEDIAPDTMSAYLEPVAWRDVLRTYKS